MVVFKKVATPATTENGLPNAPLTWCPIGPEAYGGHNAKIGHVALVVCGNGHVSAVKLGAGGHTLDADGTGHPSYKCPDALCTFHPGSGQWRLEGWKP